MREKFFVVVMTLVMTSTALTVLKDVNVEASNTYGNPELDHDYIVDTTHNLSNITFEDTYRNWGRFFGTDGERYAAYKIEDWMNDIGLDCVHNETINSTWTAKDFWEMPMDVELESARVMKTFYLNISMHHPINGTLIEYKNLSNTQCFPYYQHKINKWNEPSYRNESGTAIVVEKFSRLPLPQMELCDTHYSEPYEKLDWLENFQPHLREYIQGLWWYKGYIAINNDTDSFFQSPPYHPCEVWRGWTESQGFYVNGSIGKWIRESIYNMSRRILASYETRWVREDVVSYNVIGQINGTDTSKVNIVGAHYDAMPGQGTIDEAGETALVLGIAKYIKDHELESELKHTVKFIAFGSEEPGMRGAKDYVTKHNDSENYSYFINPGNFGSYNRTGTDYYDEPITMDFKLASRQSWLAEMADEISDAMSYTPRTNLTGTGSIESVSNNTLVAEDSLIFGIEDKNYVEDGIIQFRRGPFSGYHCDGDNHTAGDIYSGLDQATFNLECEVVASVALHLLLNLDYQYENCSFIAVDLDGDGNNDSVNITVNMSTNNNATLFGNSIGGLYNGTTWALSSELKDTSLLPLQKNNITTTNLTVTLLPDKPKDNYKLNLSLFDPLDELHDYCNQTFYLHPINEPYADFYYVKTNTKLFLFYDTSLPSPGYEINSWNWSFGDGNYSNQQNPSHTYANEGTYEVILTVTDSQNLTDNVTEILTATNSVASASFNMNANVKVKNNAITFTSTSSDSDGNILNTTWYFGDGSVGYGSSLAHTYTKSDVYTVKMVVTDDDGGVNSTTDTVYIAGALVDDSYPGDVPSQHKWTTMQGGINDVRDDELVYVFNGNYNNAVTVNKSISLYGEEEENTVITNSGTAIDIVNESVVLDGFTIENAATGIRINDINSSFLSNCNISNSTYGIKIENNAVGNIIVNCNFTNNSYGVYISGSQNNIVGTFSDIEHPDLNDCVFLQNDYGIYLSNADNNYIFGCNIDATPPSSPGRPPPMTWGICLDNSDNNSIVFCDVFNSSNYGMYLGGSVNNTITNCIIRENDKGIYLSGSSDNSIVWNNISDSSFAGVSILTLSSTGNNVFWNDFIRNGQISRVQAEDFGSNNNWNSSENITFMYDSSGEGNHWGDYSGTDSDGDGIGDTAYSISGTASAQDSYPVMEEYGWLYKWF